MMNTGHATMTSTSSQNNLASNIPLPPGTPPPIHLQHQQQQPQQIPIFGSATRPMTSFSTLAKRSESVLESTLHEYGPGLATPATSQLSHSFQVTPNLIQQRQMHLQQHQQQQQILQRQQQQQQQPQHQQQMLQQQQPQQMLQHPMLQRQHQTRIPYLQPSQAYQQQSMMTQNQITLMRNNSLQQGMSRPPVYLTNPIPPHCQPTPTTAVPTYHITPNPVPSSGAASFSQNNTIIVPQSTNDSQTVTSPLDTSISPPLDAIRGSGHPNNITLTTPPDPREHREQQEQRAASPQNDTEKDLLTQVKDNWEKWTLNQMIQEHISLGQQLKVSQQERDRFERDIADLVRKNPGQNIELNPLFIRKKRDLADMKRKCEDMNQAIKFVAEKSDRKYGRKLDAANTRQPLQNVPSQPRKPQRAKMSTATASPNTTKDNPKDTNYLLDLRDDNLWCQACDAHFKNLKEYCSHLHKRDHNINAETTSQPPWRKDNHKRQIGRYETFCKYKSMCTEVDATVDTEFKMIHLDKVLNPSKDKEEVKLLAMKRERKQFEDNDNLFGYKGYDEIVPISGFYCKLCDRTMCDEREVDLHLRGYLHNHEHVKSIALQPSHEKDFRVKMGKSLGKLNATKSSSLGVNVSKESHSKLSTIRERSPGASNGLASTGGARLPYKKPTSKIVDEHDIIADKFKQRREKEASSSKTLNADKSKISSKPSSKVRSPTKRSKIPDIVAVSESQPAAALKRLKRDKLRELPKELPKELPEELPGELPEELPKEIPEVEIDINDDENQGADLAVHSDTEEEPYDSQVDATMVEQEKNTENAQPETESHLPMGDPNSPFPHLHLSINGNYRVDVLKDKRLCEQPVVVMNWIDLKDYGGELLPRSSQMRRINDLMAKKEKDQYQKELDTVTEIVPTYFNPSDGVPVPVRVQPDHDSSDEGEEFKMDSLTSFFCS